MSETTQSSPGAKSSEATIWSSPYDSPPTLGSASTSPTSPPDCPARSRSQAITNIEQVWILGRIALELFAFDSEPHPDRKNWSCPFSDCHDNFTTREVFLKHICVCPYITTKKVYCNTCRGKDCFSPPVQHGFASPTKRAIAMRKFANFFCRSRSASKAPSRASEEPESPRLLQSSQGDLRDMVPTVTPVEMQGRLHHYGDASTYDPMPAIYIPAAAIELDNVQPTTELEALGFQNLSHLHLISNDSYVHFPSHERNVGSAAYSMPPETLDALGIMSNPSASTMEPSTQNRSDAEIVSPPDWHFDQRALPVSAETSPQVEVCPPQVLPYPGVFQRIAPADMSRHRQDAYITLRTPTPKRKVDRPITIDNSELSPKERGAMNNFQNEFSAPWQDAINGTDVHSACSGGSTRGDLSSPSASQKTNSPVHSYSSSAADAQELRCTHTGCSYSPTGKPENLSIYLRKHIRDTHAITKLICPDCRKGIKRKDNLQTHRKSACSKRPYQSAEEETGGEEEDRRKKHAMDRGE
jgi:hypothetical protein